jgi:hypothetical protein
MAMTSVSDFSLFINEQIKIQEQISTYLRGLEALISVAVMMSNFYDLPERILHNYFSIADGLIEEATKANQASIRELFEQAR